MKNTAIPLLVGSLLAACAPAPETPGDPAEVEAVARAFYEALDSDAEILSGMLTADFQAVDAGQRMDRAGFEGFIATAVADGVDLEFNLSQFATRVAGEVGYTTFEAWNAHRETTYFETLILVRSPSGWLVDRLHSTPMRPAASDSPGEG